METQNLSDLTQYPILQEITNFIVDRRARQRSERTIQLYRDELTHLAKYLLDQGIKGIPEVQPGHLRRFFIHLGQTRNTGGVHASFRAVKCFFNWWEEEMELPKGKNPIRKVRVDAPSRDPKPGIPIEQVHAMTTTCDRSLMGVRDTALLLFLVDSGVRMTEMVNLNIEDIDLESGSVHVKRGKGDRPRFTYVGSRTRQAVTRYLRMRSLAQPTDPLWANVRNGKRLSPKGLRSVVRNRAEMIGLKEPGLHDFRRTFAIERLRNGCDIYTLMGYMGHRSTDILQRYLRLVESDLEKANERSSPVNNS